MELYRRKQQEIQDAKDSSQDSRFTSLETPPTKQILTSGSGTYTTPAGVRYLRVRMVGGGGGGGGTGGSGGTGGTTLFGTDLTCVGGGGGAGATSQGRGGNGGSATIAANPNINGIAMSGNGGGAGIQPSGIPVAHSGAGGAGPFGGGQPGFGGVDGGQTAPANSGAGGAGRSASNTSSGGDGGGGSGGYIDAIIINPDASYSYTIGGGGAGGSGSGGSGGSGVIIVEEFY